MASAETKAVMATLRAGSKEGKDARNSAENYHLRSVISNSCSVMETHLESLVEKLDTAGVVSTEVSEDLHALAHAVGHIKGSLNG